MSHVKAKKSPNTRPTSCYVTPPLKSEPHYVNMDESMKTPSSDTFSFTDSPTISPVSSFSPDQKTVVPKTPSTSNVKNDFVVSPPSRPGILKRISSRFSRSTSKTTSPRTKEVEVMESTQTVVASPPKSEKSPLMRSFSFRSRSRRSSRIESSPTSPVSSPVLQASPSIRKKHSLRSLQDPPVITREHNSPNAGYRHSVYGSNFQQDKISTPRIPEADVFTSGGEFPARSRSINKTNSSSDVPSHLADNSKALETHSVGNLTINLDSGSTIKSTLSASKSSISLYTNPSVNLSAVSNASKNNQYRQQSSENIEELAGSRRSLVRKPSLDRVFPTIPESSRHSSITSSSRELENWRSQRAALKSTSTMSSTTRRDSNPSSRRDSYSSTRFGSNSSFAFSQEGLGITTFRDSKSSLIEPTGPSKIRRAESILKLKIYIEEHERQLGDVEFTALRMRKDELKNINELINLVMFKLLSKRQDLNMNSVRLLIFFKDKSLNPIVLKKSISERESQKSSHRKYISIDLNNNEILLDYIKAKEKLYIKVQLDS